MIVDSRASEHVVIDSTWFGTVEDVDKATVEFADGNKIYAKQKGKLSVSLGRCA